MPELTVREWFQEKHAESFPELRLLTEKDLQPDSLWNRILGRRKVVEVSILLASSQGYSHQAKKYPYQVNGNGPEIIESLAAPSIFVRRLSPQEFLGNTPLPLIRQSVKVFLAKR